MSAADILEGSVAAVPVFFGFEGSVQSAWNISFIQWLDPSGCTVCRRLLILCRGLPLV